MIQIPDVGKSALQWQLWRGSRLGISNFQWQVHLAKADVVVTNGTTLADFAAVEADFTGYVPVEIQFMVDSGIISPGVWQYLFDTALFAVTGAGPAQSVYWYWVDGINVGAARELLFCERFPVPVDMSTPLQTVGFVPQFSFRQI